MNVYRIGYTKVQRPEGSGQDGVRAVLANSPNEATDALRKFLTIVDSTLDVGFNHVQEVAKDVLDSSQFLASGITIEGKWNGGKP